MAKPDPNTNPAAAARVLVNTDTNLPDVNQPDNNKYIAPVHNIDELDHEVTESEELEHEKNCDTSTNNDDGHAHDSDSEPENDADDNDN